MDVTLALMLRCQAEIFAKKQHAMSRHIKAGNQLPDLLLIRSRLIPASEHRYATRGDWWWQGDTLEIRISREEQRQNPLYPFLLLVHEMVEALLCRLSGITTEEVDALDMNYGGDGEPGDDPRAPYRWEHATAELVERVLAKRLSVNWQDYLKGGGDENLD